MQVSPRLRPKGRLAATGIAASDNNKHSGATKKCNTLAKVTYIFTCWKILSVKSPADFETAAGHISLMMAAEEPKRVHCCFSHSHASASLE
jgi:hypothetical protein